MMFVIGLVSIPGMMTGQILGGTDPWQAAMYQMLIVYLIAGSAFFAIFNVLIFCLNKSFEPKFDSLISTRVFCLREKFGVPQPASNSTTGKAEESVLMGKNAGGNKNQEKNATIENAKNTNLILGFVVSLITSFGNVLRDIRRLVFVPMAMPGFNSDNSAHHQRTNTTGDNKNRTINSPRQETPCHSVAISVGINEERKSQFFDTHLKLPLLTNEGNESGVEISSSGTKISFCIKDAAEQLRHTSLLSSVPSPTTGIAEADQSTAKTETFGGGGRENVEPRTVLTVKNLNYGIIVLPSMNDSIISSSASNPGTRNENGQNDLQTAGQNRRGFAHANTTSDKNLIYLNKNVNLELKAGQLCIVKGRNGSGKTSFLKCISLLSDVFDGEILLNGVNAVSFDPHEWRRKVRFITQSRVNFEGSPMKLIDQICGFESSSSISSSSRNSSTSKNRASTTVINNGSVASTTSPKRDEPDVIKRSVCTLLNSWGQGLLGDKLESDWKTLSGGEAQGIFAAINLSFGDPEVLLLDESAAALDPETTQHDFFVIRLVFLIFWSILRVFLIFFDILSRIMKKFCYTTL